MSASGRETLFGHDAGDAAPDEVGLFLPVGAIFPDVEPTERQLVDLLSGLDRDGTLIHCAWLNIIVSGPGNFETKRRQEQAIALLCTPAQRERINEFARGHGGRLSAYGRDVDTLLSMAEQLSALRTPINKVKFARSVSLAAREEKAQGELF